MSKSNVKHTPGVWNCIIRSNADGIYGYIGPSEMGGAGIAQVECPTPEGEANARLIAAAPEMLEALIDARSLLETIDGREACEACIQLCAVIEKATGGAS